LKLERLTNIPVLTAIEDNAEKFIDTAGFKLVQSGRKEVRIAYEYIESWKKEKITYYGPTWTGLFAVLRQIGLNSLAMSIDSFLRETSPSVEQLVERKDPENGKYMAVTFLAYNILIIMIFMQAAMDLLVKLKESLIELTIAEPKRLQMGVIACANKCDEVLQKLKIEKTDASTERELESRKDQGVWPL
jgi:hypothetical protein